jgi:hypothetical protein
MLTSTTITRGLMMTEWEFGIGFPVKGIKRKFHYIRQETPVKQSISQ